MPMIAPTSTKKPTISPAPIERLPLDPESDPGNVPPWFFPRRSVPALTDADAMPSSSAAPAAITGSTTDTSAPLRSAASNATASALRSVNVGTVV